MRLPNLEPICLTFCPTFFAVFSPFSVEIAQPAQPAQPQYVFFKKRKK